MISKSTHPPLFVSLASHQMSTATPLRPLRFSPPLSPSKTPIIAMYQTLLLLSATLLLLLPSIGAATVSISVSPTTLAKSGDSVRIRWSGVPSPSDLDWLGIYSPPNSRDKEFIGYVFLSSSTGWRSGSGSIDLPLVNLRVPYQFRIFRWTRDEVDEKHHDHDNNPLPGVRHRLAVSEVVGFANLKGPEQIHLSFTDREDEMRVLFVTGDGSPGYVVRYGVEEGRMDEVAGTEVRRYEREHMCDSPANSSVGWRDPGFVHDGVMRNLKHGTRYYYKVGSDSGGWSAIHSFVSRDNESNETIAFLFGDMGAYAPYATFRRLQEESRSTVKWILRDIAELGDKSSFVSHIGDISYARGYSWLWDEFFNQIEPIAATVPYHVCIGNHEYDWPQQPWRPSWSYGSYGTDGGGECGVPYSIKFNMPGNSSLPTGTNAPDTRNLYYSFDAGVVHFLYISTETDFLRGSAQYNFIKHDLESVNREKTPYIVIQGHRPMYTTSNEIRDTPLRSVMLEHLEPLLVENNVTLALWGHVHRYERFCALRNYSCVDNSFNSDSGGSTVHVVIGMAGQDWQPIWTPRPDHTDVPIFPQPERSLYRGGEFGYTRLVATREKLTLTYIGNHDGQAHDMVEILSGYTAIGDKVNSSANVAMDEEGNAVSKASKARSKVVAAFNLWYVKYAFVLLVGAFGGFALGFLARLRRYSNSNGTWTRVGSEETITE